ncbi:MAG: zinc ribbon domain-containing protein, partial [Nitrososphaerales archaeon]
MYCLKCGAQLPDDAKFCFKCGATVPGSDGGSAAAQPESDAQVLAPSGATQLKCPSCGAPIAPKFGEMIITCEYCGSSVTLGNAGWKSIQKHSMLKLTYQDQNSVAERIKSLMDRGFLKRHLEEQSQQEELTLSFVPYWVIPVSARTNVVASNTAATVGTVATEAALFGILAGAGNRGGGGFGGGLFEGAVLGSVMGGGMGGGGGYKKAFSMNANYNYPVVGLKSLNEYQPKDYSFNLDQRMLFDVSKIPKNTKVLNGDVGEDAAKYQAKTFVDQLQSDKAHKQYHMIQSIQSQEDVSEGELLHAPIWFARYDHKGKKIVLVLDANSGGLINSIGL